MKIKRTLKSQLITLLCVLFILFIITIVPIVNYNLTSIIDGEMYSILEDAQENYIMGIFNPEEIDSTRQCYHMDVYYDEMTGFHFRAERPLNRNMMEEVSYVILNDLTTQLNQKKIFIENKTELNNETLFYRSLLIDSTTNMLVVSFMSDDYSSALSTTIASELIYLQYAGFLVLALIMIVWVTSFIKPLHQIKEYIDDIKEGKKGSLNIKRYDEIGAVANALVEMDEELKHQNKIKEEMIHNISHDLKTPIALIETYAQSIKDDIYPYGDKETSVDIILENASRLEKKVKNLLYLNRLDYIKDSQKEFGQIEMKDLIEKTVEQLTSLHPEVVVEMELEEHRFIGEEEHWRIAIENILQNAYRYVTGKIKIQLQNQTLIIYNDGPNISEEVLDTIFQPFVKGNKGQFGLGLYIVYKTVEMYGYMIEVVNEETGVSFIIRKR